MSTANKIWLCLVTTAFVTLAVSQALSSRHAHAQQPPPNPTPIPCAACCDLPSGGLTIAGPGDGIGQIFASTRPRNICVTVKNDHTEAIRVRFFEVAIVLGEGIRPVGDSERLETVIFPGDVTSVCDGRTAVVGIGCPPGTTCSIPVSGAVRWRVDNAE